MVKYYCDTCGKEVKKLQSIEYLCHIEDIFSGSVNGYSDSDGNRISRKVVGADVCITCYNQIMCAMYDKLLKVREEHADNL